MSQIENYLWCTVRVYKGGFWQHTMVCHLNCEKKQGCKDLKKYEKQRVKLLAEAEENAGGWYGQLTFLD